MSVSTLRKHTKELREQLLVLIKGVEGLFTKISDLIKKRKDWEEENVWKTEDFKAEEADEAAPIKARIRPAQWVRLNNLCRLLKDNGKSNKNPSGALAIEALKHLVQYEELYSQLGLIIKDMGDYLEDNFKEKISSIQKLKFRESVYSLASLSRKESLVDIDFNNEQSRVEPFSEGLSPLYPQSVMNENSLKKENIQEIGFSCENKPR